MVDLSTTTDPGGCGGSSSSVELSPGHELELLVYLVVLGLRPRGEVVPATPATAALAVAIAALGRARVTTLVFLLVQGLSGRNTNSYTYEYIEVLLANRAF